MEAGLFEIAASVRLALGAGVPPVQAFAMASGVPPAVIAEHEAGRRELTRDECDALGLALGVPCELLLDPSGASNRRSIVEGEYRTGI